MTNRYSWVDQFWFPDNHDLCEGFERNQATWKTMTPWISENIDGLNIKNGLCTGVWNSITNF